MRSRIFYPWKIFDIKWIANEIELEHLETGKIEKLCAPKKKRQSMKILRLPFQLPHFCSCIAYFTNNNSFLFPPQILLVMTHVYKFNIFLGRKICSTDTKEATVHIQTTAIQCIQHLHGLKNRKLYSFDMYAWVRERDSARERKLSIA